MRRQQNIKKNLSFCSAFYILTFFLFGAMNIYRITSQWRCFCPILTKLTTYLHIWVKSLNLWRFMKSLPTVFKLLRQPCMHLYWSLPR